MIRPATELDFEAIHAVINDAAIAYKGVIPADRWHEPYMSKAELQEQIADGVRFVCYVEAGEVIGVMGIQARTDLDLIRHAYVSTAHRQKGIGTLLIKELLAAAERTILIGTWKAATWAINFYQKHGFALVSESDKTRLLKTYWNIPERQIETSVVLSNGQA